MSDLDDGKKKTAAAGAEVELGPVGGGAGDGKKARTKKAHKGKKAAGEAPASVAPAEEKDSDSPSAPAEERVYADAVVEPEKTPEKDKKTRGKSTKKETTTTTTTTAEAVEEEPKDAKDLMREAMMQISTRQDALDRVREQNKSVEPTVLDDDSILLYQPPDLPSISVVPDQDDGANESNYVSQPGCVLCCFKCC